ncbi:E3 ubiquitin-protein ligase XIAP-like isoform X2 [Haliotis rufescens]|uniref:E3 ubiquitin-protein ligase XIAP-like isoform X2 n=1 Tax=Haliotis rufescens TaxID=6454 RepID=UPI00201E9552|nr:E3 ubiquitin-protein ligase XIAP-like isoform X2 [Haliotis rufescens]
MDTDPAIVMSDSLKRLASFQEYPLPSPGGRNHASLLRYNSPLKLSKAGFFRPPNARGDEVKCFKCFVSHWGWSGESPMAVHRILSPDCAFVARHTPAILTARTPGRIRTGAPCNVRRRLQMGSPTSTEGTHAVTDAGIQEQSVLEVYDRYNSNTPRTPEHSDSETEGEGQTGSMLFESHRLLTYPSPTHPRAEEWAGSGFVYQRDGGVVRCVFCGLTTTYDEGEPASLHQEKSKNCPLVKYLDVGNIPRDLENKIRSQHLEQSCDNNFVSGDPMFKHPQFEETQGRLETFKYWSKQIRPTADQLCQAGFYFTGYADRVVCFACGCSLRNWDPEADPWVQHARHAPHCVYVKQQKGDNFVMDAQEAETLTETDTVDDQCSTSGSPATPSPLRPSLDMEAIKAALACGFYPNDALLLGTLRASDVNFSQLQKQRETIYTNYMSLIRQSEALQQHKQEIARNKEDKERTQEEYHTELSREQAQRRCEVRDLQVHNRTLTDRLQGQAQVMQRHSQVVQDKDHQLQDKDHQLGHQGEELDRKQRALNSLAVENRRQAEENRRKDEENRRQAEEMRRQAEENRRQAEEMRRQAEENRRQAEELERLKQLLQANNIQNNGPVNANNNAAAAVAPVVPVAAVAPAVPAVSNNLRCKVCLEEEAQCLFRPCRHVCCGTQCAPHFIGNRCPICRDNVSDWEIVYVA